LQLAQPVSRCCGADPVAQELPPERPAQQYAERLVLGVRWELAALAERRAVQSELAAPVRQTVQPEPVAILRVELLVPAAPRALALRLGQPLSAVPVRLRLMATPPR
jgi:hypothetical protein